MGFQIEDGAGSGKLVAVSGDNRLKINSKTAERIYYCSRDDGDAFKITTFDSAAAASEFTLWLQNNSETDFVIHKIYTGCSAGDVQWKLWNTSGQTGAGADVITPQVANLKSSLTANLTVRGSNGTGGGVTGLTAHGSQTKPLHQWYNGAAYTTQGIDTDDTIRIGQNQSIALEYEAGTGGGAIIVIIGYYDETT